MFESGLNHYKRTELQSTITGIENDFTDEIDGMKIITSDENCKGFMFGDVAQGATNEAVKGVAASRGLEHQLQIKKYAAQLRGQTYNPEIEMERLPTPPQYQAATTQCMTIPDLSDNRGLHAGTRFFPADVSIANIKVSDIKPSVDTKCTPVGDDYRCKVDVKFPKTSVSGRVKIDDKETGKSFMMPEIMATVDNGDGLDIESEFIISSQNGKLKSTADIQCPKINKDAFRWRIPVRETLTDGSQRLLEPEEVQQFITAERNRLIASELPDGIPASACLEEPRNAACPPIALVQDYERVARRRVLGGYSENVSTEYFDTFANFTSDLNDVYTVNEGFNDEVQKLVCQEVDHINEMLQMTVDNYNDEVTKVFDQKTDLQVLALDRIAADANRQSRIEEIDDAIKSVKDLMENDPYEGVYGQNKARQSQLDTLLAERDRLAQMAAELAPERDRSIELSTGYLFDRVNDLNRFGLFEVSKGPQCIQDREPSAIKSSEDLLYADGQPYDGGLELNVDTIQAYLDEMYLESPTVCLETTQRPDMDVGTCPDGIAAKIGRPEIEFVDGKFQVRMPALDIDGGRLLADARFDADLSPCKGKDTTSGMGNNICLSLSNPSLDNYESSGLGKLAWLADFGSFRGGDTQIVDGLNSAFQGMGTINITEGLLPPNISNNISLSQGRLNKDTGSVTFPVTVQPRLIESLMEGDNASPSANLP
jgi:hypothetical protein